MKIGFVIPREITYDLPTVALSKETAAKLRELARESGSLGAALTCAIDVAHSTLVVKRRPMKKLPKDLRGA